MDIKIIENALKDYKIKKSVIETTLARVDTYQYAIDNPESHGGIENVKEPGMPVAAYKGTSAVEHVVLSREEEVFLLKEWIKEDKSRIYPYQVEIEQIDGALSALNKQQRFILEQKYFEGMFWRELEKNFNDRFREHNYITAEGVRKINKQSLELLVKILKPYYSRLEMKKYQKSTRKVPALEQF